MTSRDAGDNGGPRHGGYEQICVREARRLGQQKISGWWLKRWMRMASETHDDDCGGGTDAVGNVQSYWTGNFDGVPIGRTTTADPMTPTPSLAEKRPTKKLPAQCIRCGIAEAVMVSLPDVLYTVFKRRTAATAMAGSLHGEGQKLGICTTRK